MSWGCPRGEWLTALADGALDVDMRDHVIAHVDVCASCAERLAAERAAKGWLSGAGGGRTGWPSESSLPRWDGLPLRGVDPDNSFLLRLTGLPHERDLAATRPLEPIAAPQRGTSRRVAWWAGAGSVGVLALTATAFALPQVATGVPTVVPPVQAFAEEHAVSTDDLPLPGPGLDLTSVVFLVTPTGSAASVPGPGDQSVQQSSQQSVQQSTLRSAPPTTSTTSATEFPGLPVLTASSPMPSATHGLLGTLGR